MKTATAFSENSTIVRINKKAQDLLPDIMRVLSTVLPGPSSHIAEKLFFRTPSRVALTDGEKKFLETGHAGRIVVNGKTIKLWSWGNGPTVMVVHGWGSRAGRLQAVIHKLVEEGFSVVTFDAPAHGDSDGTTTSIVEYASVIEEVASWAGSVHAVVGHSWGGASLALALKQGLRIDKAVCQDGRLLRPLQKQIRSVGQSRRDPQNEDRSQSRSSVRGLEYQKFRRTAQSAGTGSSRS
jgi:pimeloyl-ACP methyl ester carboxylesterase